MGYRSNVWAGIPTGYNKSTKDHIAHRHSAIQSEGISDAIIRCFSRPHEKILDLFSGSGTTLKSACLNNREAVGIERARKYVLLSAQRLKPYCKDITLSWR
jgi:DNA modification methylase